jgi:hypothetical protein
LQVTTLLWLHASPILSLQVLKDGNLNWDAQGKAIRRHVAQALNECAAVEAGVDTGAPAAAAGSNSMQVMQQALCSGVLSFCLVTCSISRYYALTNSSLSSTLVIQK